MSGGEGGLVVPVERPELVSIHSEQDELGVVEVEVEVGSSLVIEIREIVESRPRAWGGGVKDRGRSAGRV